MSGRLILNQIEGKSGASNIVTVPTGHRVVGVDTGSVYSPGSVIQAVKNATSSGVTIASSSATAVISTSITIRQGSRIFAFFSADMNADAADAWQIIGFKIGSTQYHDKIIEHSGTKNMNADSCYLSPTLNAGTYTVEFNSRRGSGTVTYNEGTFGEGIVIMAMEVA